MILSAEGRIRRNAEHFDDQGIFIGGQADSPQFSIRQGNQYLRYEPATGLEIRGDVKFGVSSTFSPSWTGFASPPPNQMRYADLGTHAMIWSPLNLGTSNGTTFGFSGIPAAVRPAQQAIVPVVCADGGQIVPGFVVIGANGAATVYRHVISGTSVAASSTSWTSTGQKGLQAGVTMFFPKD